MVSSRYAAFIAIFSQLSLTELRQIKELFFPLLLRLLLIVNLYLHWLLDKGFAYRRQVVCSQLLVRKPGQVPSLSLLLLFAWLLLFLRRQLSRG